MRSHPTATQVLTHGKLVYGSRIVQSLIEPLSANGIGVFVVCTFDGEHLLISAGDMDTARLHLSDAGHNWVEHTVQK